MSTEPDALRESVARAICRAQGLNPDRELGPMARNARLGGPRAGNTHIWQDFITAADAAIAVVRKHTDAAQ